MDGTKKVSHEFKALGEFFARMQESAELTRKMLAPTIKAQEIFAETMRPIIEGQKKLQKSLEPYIEKHRQMIEAANCVTLPANIATDLSKLTISVIEFQTIIQKLVRPAFQKLQDNFAVLPDRTRNAVLTLGNNGWYWDPEMLVPDLWTVQRGLEKGDVADTEKALVEYFRGRLADIEESIATKYPHRAKIIRAAFKAHSIGEYELSIPVLLSQTDGICREVVGQYLFIKSDKKPSTAIYVKTIATDTYRAALLEPLAQTLPISKSESERGKGFNELNRHMVLHEESLDYGTEIYGLKAISLINYVAYVLRPDENKP